MFLFRKSDVVLCVTAIVELVGHVIHMKIFNLSGSMIKIDDSDEIIHLTLNT